MVKEDLLQIVYKSDDPEDNLKTITVLNLPVSKVGENGDDTVDSQIKDSQINSFFEKFVADELFQRNRELSLYSFESLKIWIYYASQGEAPQSDRLPIIDNQAIKMRSHLDTSELKQIVVLDVGLPGNQRVLWEEACKELLTPLFGRFVPPAKPPDILRDFLIMRVGPQASNQLDLYLNMRDYMCFDSLIVQAK